jgi:hypothetical protein
MRSNQTTKKERLLAFADKRGLRRIWDSLNKLVEELTAMQETELLFDLNKALGESVNVTKSAFIEPGL